MPRAWSIAEARDHLPSLVHEAEQGGRVSLTRRGKAVAVLISVSEYDRLTTWRWDSFQGMRMRTMNPLGLLLNIVAFATGCADHACEGVVEGSLNVYDGEVAKAYLKKAVHGDALQETETMEGTFAFTGVREGGYSVEVEQYRAPCDVEWLARVVDLACDETIALVDEDFEKDFRCPE